MDVTGTPRELQNSNEILNCNHQNVTVWKKPYAMEKFKIGKGNEKFRNNKNVVAKRDQFSISEIKIIHGKHKIIFEFRWLFEW